MILPPQPIPYPVKTGINLIGIHGKAGAGKDTVSDFITESYENHYWEAFANPLKEVASKAFGIPISQLYDSTFKEVEGDFWGVSPRQISQYLGTEMFRVGLAALIPGIGADFWVKRMQGILNGDLVDPLYQDYYVPGDTVVISDVRFQNEYDFIISNGGIIIHLTRPGADGTVGIPNHISESDINLYNKERTFLCENNGTILDLQEKIASILISF
jgi:hypothetical protein